MWVTCFAGRLRVVVAVFVVVASVAVGDELVSVGAAVLVSLGGGAVSVVGGAVVEGAVSVGTGCACWARTAVEESARAAAIAGRALVRI
jgi:hypothetical protein